MKMLLPRLPATLAALALGVNLIGDGCAGRDGGPPGYPPLGTLSDPMWQIQEDNAEPSKFVIHQHEWTLNTTRLNTAGEDHLKQIAARLGAGQNFAVIIERSETSVREATEFHYPIHPNAELDMRRRDVVVQALTMLGVADAPQRVVVSAPITRGYWDFEAERAFYRSYLGNAGGNGGFGGNGAFGGFGGAGGGAGGGGVF